MKAVPTSRLVALLHWAWLATPCQAIDNDNLQFGFFNGWDGFEIISQGDDPAGDGSDYAMPGVFDGIGARILGSTLRVQINHEISSGGAGVSEVLLDLASFRAAIGHVIANGGSNTGGITFVTSARQAYDRWSPDGGTTWIPTSDGSSTSFSRFCSGQSYEPNTFGVGRGFVDPLYITGEEVAGGRLFALDPAAAAFYQVSGVAGAGGAGIGGMPFDAWENAALVDTGESDHIALLLSPDGGTSRMQLYIGEKGSDADGNPAADFLSRNGLARGGSYFLNASLPATSGVTDSGGFFDTTAADALTSTKLEDVDTSPAHPDRVVLGDQDSGVFSFDFDLDFSSGSFDAGTSGFSVTRIAAHISAANALGSADNVDWTDATVLGGTPYPDGLIFVNEDNSSGEVWMMHPDGSGQTLIASTLPSTESTGILDISPLLGYNAGSIVLVNEQTASLAVLIHPQATKAPGPATVFFSYSPGTGVAELEWVGGVGAYYRVVRDDDLDFSNAVPVVPESVSKGTPRGEFVVAGPDGRARIQANPGSGSRSFLRVETP
jgi:hypothetical protein